MDDLHVLEDDYDKQMRLHPMERDDQSCEESEDELEAWGKDIREVISDSSDNLSSDSDGTTDWDISISSSSCDASDHGDMDSRRLEDWSFEAWSDEDVYTLQE